MVVREEAEGERRNMESVTTTREEVVRSVSESSASEAASEGLSEGFGLCTEGRGEVAICEEVMRYCSFSSSEPAMVSQVEVRRSRRSIEVAALGRGSGWVAGVGSVSLSAHRTASCVSEPREGGAEVAEEGEEAEGGVTVTGAAGEEDQAGLLLPRRVEGMREVVEVEARGGKATPGERAAAAGVGWVQAG